MKYNFQFPLKVSSTGNFLTTTSHEVYGLRVFFSIPQGTRLRLDDYGNRFDVLEQEILASDEIASSSILMTILSLEKYFQNTVFLGTGIARSNRKIAVAITWMPEIKEEKETFEWLIQSI